MKVIEYFYAAHSAFAYLGSARFMAIAAASGRKIAHRPVDLRRVVAEEAGGVIDVFADKLRELAAEIKAAGGQAVDAPVTGSVDAAIRGDMPMFVGGDDAVIERIRPVIEAMGRLRRVGAYGNGYVAKLVNNQLWKIHAAAIGEAMVTAKLAGLDPLTWWEVMKGGAADSFVLSHDVPSIFAGHYDPSFPIALCLKDLALIRKLLDQTGTNSTLTDATYDRFREAARRYGTAAGEMTVCKVLEVMTKSTKPKKHYRKITKNCIVARRFQTRDA